MHVCSARVVWIDGTQVGTFSGDVDVDAGVHDLSMECVLRYFPDTMSNTFSVYVRVNLVSGGQYRVDHHVTEDRKCELYLVDAKTGAEVPSIASNR